MPANFSWIMKGKGSYDIFKFPNHTNNYLNLIE